VSKAIDSQGVNVSPHTSHYVVNLLTLFARSEDLYEDDGDHYGVRPLALMLADAAAAESCEQRNTSLRRIGDVALFTAGFFVESFASRAVDIDYYIRMGGNAYQSLGDEMRGTVRGVALASVYSELARKFQAMVDVLHEVRDGAGGRSDLDVMQTLDWWHKTGSQRAERLLRECGIVPLGKAGRKH
jgi:hypothetical protein